MLRPCIVTSKKLLQKIPADTKNRLRNAFEANSLSQQEGSFEQLLDRFEDLLFDSCYPVEEGRRVDRYPLSILPDLLVSGLAFRLSFVCTQISEKQG